MNNRIIISIVIMLTGLMGQAQHYPFPHDEDNENFPQNENSSNCREYAMARAFYGNYCPAADLGDKAEKIEESPVFIIKPWNDELVQKYDIALWGIDGSGHAAYISEKYGNNFNQIYVDQKPSSDQEDVVVVGKHLDWTKNNIQAVFGFDGYNGIQDSIGYPNYYARLNKDSYWKLTVENEFWDGSGGDSVKVDGAKRPSPYTKYVEWGRSHSLEAHLDGIVTSEGHKNKFIEWQKMVNYNWETISENPNPLTIYVTDDEMETKFKVVYDRVFQVNVKNEFKGVGNLGYLIVNDTNRTMPYSTDVIVEDSITLSAPINPQTYNHIDYEFTHWSTGSEFHTITVTPTENMTITAHYEGRPKPMTNYNYNLILNPGQKVKMSWNDHPNLNVTRYQIWRQIKYKNGWPRDSTLVSIVNRGTTNWTDPTYTVTSSYIVDLLEYDVRALYSTENTLAKDDWLVCFGMSRFAPKELTDMWNDLIPKEYILTHNYPNPFNPITAIGYALPTDSHIRINIYNLKGQLVKTLVNQSKTAGYHTVTWDIKDNAREEIAAGIYLYQIVTPEFTDTKKLVVMK